MGNDPAIQPPQCVRKPESPQPARAGRWPAPLLAQADGPQLAAILVPDPLDALQLRVHDEGPALRVAQNRGILSGHAVAGEALVVPSGHVCVIRQQAQGVQTFRDGDGDLPGRSAGSQAWWLMWPRLRLHGKRLSRRHGGTVVS